MEASLSPCRLEDKQEELVLLTNQFRLAASTIAAIDKDRWQIELFFKLLKQQLRIQTFVGTSSNAVRIQVWTALIAVLVLRYLQFRSRLAWALSNLVALLRWNLFTYRDLWEWLNRPFDTPPQAPQQLELNLDSSEYHGNTGTVATVNPPDDGTSPRRADRLRSRRRIAFGCAGTWRLTPASSPYAPGMKSSGSVNTLSVRYRRIDRSCDEIQESRQSLNETAIAALTKGSDWPMNRRATTISTPRRNLAGGRRVDAAIAARTRSMPASGNETGARHHCYVDFCRGDSEVVERMREADRIYLPFVTLAELRAGFSLGPRPVITSGC
jgi:hypothetical protein